MGIASGIVVYVLLWWWVFIMALPFGVRRQENVESGHDRGAPEKPHLWKKVLAATLIAAALWILAFAIIEAEVISFRSPARQD